MSKASDDPAALDIDTADEHTDFTAISPRPLGESVASAFISTKGGTYYAHAITPHNFQPAVPSEYGATTLHMTDDIDSYLSQREHIIEAAVANWHGDKTTVHTVGPYEYDEVSCRYEFIIEIDADPTEGNAILALLEVDPGYLAGDPDINEHVAHALREFDRISIANPQQGNEHTELAFIAHFVGLFQQDAEDALRRRHDTQSDTAITFDPATHTYLVKIATDFYRRYEGDILAWQSATQHSVAEFAYLVASGKRSSLPYLRSFDLPNPQSYALDEHVISVRLHRNMVNDLPWLPMISAFAITPDGVVTVIVPTDE